jgi:amidase
VRRLEPSTQWLRDRGRGVTHGDVMTLGERLARDVLAWFGDADILVSPTVAQPAPKVGAFEQLDGESVFRTAATFGAFTALFNVSGQPAISIPWGHTQAGLPIGVQLVARRGADRLLLALAARLTGEVV